MIIFSKEKKEKEGITSLFSSSSNCRGDIELFFSSKRYDSLLYLDDTVKTGQRPGRAQDSLYTDRLTQRRRVYLFLSRPQKQNKPFSLSLKIFRSRAVSKLPDRSIALYLCTLQPTTTTPPPPIDRDLTYPPFADLLFEYQLHLHPPRTLPRVREYGADPNTPVQRGPGADLHRPRLAVVPRWCWRTDPPIGS